VNSSRLTLVGLDIEGEWNVPLLANAAEMSGASLLFASSAHSKGEMAATGNLSVPIDELLPQFDHVLACEVTQQSRPIYDYPAPRGHLGVIVGNELRGIPGKVLKKVDQVVSIPMSGRGMSSVNVAVAAAIILYTLERDLGRRRIRTSPLLQGDVDLLLLGPPDPSELGSLLRSAWAFGWQRVFLADRNGVWFTKDRPTVLAGRAAARSEVNRIVVRPSEQLRREEYDQIVLCSSVQTGKPLSRYSLANRGRVLLVYGDGDLPFAIGESAEHVYVDPMVPEMQPCFRHRGSILLSVISQQLRQGRRG
jgi:tRNA G18 (ribose-2'-O)-methylase SpoU